ncbi:hypothetical protein ACEZCY_20565 [Streptacidiphilus sp. N1-12]|uniref:Uncharacterized protein n=2 Tax=Streptacidiphilus alkalitolerans TaxID=3342712 RepID=A0ABV6VDI4_9ACTN
MGIFRRGLKRDGPEAPRDQELTMLSEAEAALLRVQVRAAFAESGLEVTVFAAHVTDSAGRAFGLNNLAAVCHNDDRGLRAWPGLAREHVTKLLRSLDGPDVLQTLPREQLLAQLYPRLVPSDSLANPLSYCYGPPLTEGLVEVLALDLPETVQILPEHVVETIGSPAGLRARALQNLREMPVERHEVIKEQDGARIDVLMGDSYFVASLVLILDTAVQQFAGARLGPDGALVAMPFRHQLAFHAISDMTVIPSLNSMARFAATGFEEAPGAVSPSVYWWRPGAPLVRLSEKDGQGGLRVVVESEFQELLERLAAE